MNTQKEGMGGGGGGGRREEGEKRKGQRKERIEVGKGREDGMQREDI